MVLTSIQNGVNLTRYSSLMSAMCASYQEDCSGIQNGVKIMHIKPKMPMTYDPSGAHSAALLTQNLPILHVLEKSSHLIAIWWVSVSAEDLGQSLPEFIEHTTMDVPPHNYPEPLSKYKRLAVIVPFTKGYRG